MFTRATLADAYNELNKVINFLRILKQKKTLKIEQIEYRLYEWENNILARIIRIYDF